MFLCVSSTIFCTLLQYLSKVSTLKSTFKIKCKSTKAKFSCCPQAVQYTQMINDLSTAQSVTNVSSRNGLVVFQFQRLLFKTKEV